MIVKASNRTVIIIYYSNTFKESRSNTLALIFTFTFLSRSQLFISPSRSNDEQSIKTSASLFPAVQLVGAHCEKTVERNKERDA